MLGTAQNLADILDVVATVINQDSLYFVDYSGTTYPVAEKEAHFEIIITQAQWETFSAATLYVTDSIGLVTDSIYFNQ